MSGKVRRVMLLLIKRKAHRVHNCGEVAEIFQKYSARKITINEKDTILIYSDPNDHTKVDLSSISILWQEPRTRMDGEYVHTYLMYSDYKEFLDPKLREKDTIFVIGPDRKLYETFYKHNTGEVRGKGWAKFRNGLGIIVQLGFLYQNNNNLMIIGPLEKDEKIKDAIEIQKERNIEVHEKKQISTAGVLVWS